MTGISKCQYIGDIKFMSKDYRINTIINKISVALDKLNYENEIRDLSPIEETLYCDLLNAYDHLTEYETRRIKGE